jgi:hypothetical protein
MIRFSVVTPPLVDASDRLFGRWVRWTVAGEMLGFIAPAVLGMLSAGWSSRQAIAAMVAAGAVEGLLLGTAQAHALAPSLPGLRSGRFAVGTALAAALAYLLGMLPSALGPGLVEAPRALVVLAGILGGIVLLGSIGTAQWLELRRHVDRAWTWIPTTAAAWLAGLVAFLLIAMPLWHPGQDPIVVVAIGLAAAGAMATTVAVLTGLALQHLLRRVARSDLTSSRPLR